MKSGSEPDFYLGVLFGESFTDGLDTGAVNAAITVTEATDGAHLNQASRLHEQFDIIVEVHGRGLKDDVQIFGSSVLDAGELHPTDHLLELLPCGDRKSTRLNSSHIPLSR